jgi:hypothetical protein
LAGQSVKIAVDFDAQPLFVGVEVEDISASGVLSAEFETIGAAFEDAPEKDFWQRHFALQRFCKPDLSRTLPNRRLEARIWGSHPAAQQLRVASRQDQGSRCDTGAVPATVTGE